MCCLRDLNDLQGPFERESDDEESAGEKKLEKKLSCVICLREPFNYTAIIIQKYLPTVFKVKVVAVEFPLALASTEV